MRFQAVQVFRPNTFGVRTAHIHYLESSGPAGEEHTLFLPAGRYQVSLIDYPCHDKTYFADQNQPGVTAAFEVEAGKTLKQTLRVDTRKLDAKESYDNRRGIRCAP